MPKVVVTPPAMTAVVVRGRRSPTQAAQLLVPSGLLSLMEPWDVWRLYETVGAWRVGGFVAGDESFERGTRGGKDGSKKAADDVRLTNFVISTREVDVQLPVKYHDTAASALSNVHFLEIGERTPRKQPVVMADQGRRGRAAVANGGRTQQPWITSTSYPSVPTR